MRFSQTMKKGQLDLKGMAIKYVLAFFFVAVTVIALSQIGIIGKITPGGGVMDLGVTGPGHITAAAVVDDNITKEVNETTGEEMREAVEEEETT